MGWPINHFTGLPTYDRNQNENSKNLNTQNTQVTLNEKRHGLNGKETWTLSETKSKLGLCQKIDRPSRCCEAGTWIFHFLFNLQ